MKVYRLQNRFHGCGPYTCSELADKLDHHHRNLRYPSAIEDIPGFDWNEDLCGFISLSKLYKWFGHSFVQEAKKYDYVIVCYEIESKCLKFSDSKKQIAFNPDFATEEYEL